MNNSEIFKFTKELGCCGACCIRYMNIRQPSAYEKNSEYIAQFETVPTPQPEPETKENGNNGSSNGDESPPNKRRKWTVCVSCLGILQEETWQACCERVKDVMEKKKYVSPTFGCALSAPIVTIVRERIITLQIKEKFPDYSAEGPVSLKEAWKWSFGDRLASAVGKVLDSGAYSPLLVTINTEYEADLDELEPLKKLAPSVFAARNPRRCPAPFTRRSVANAIEGATIQSFISSGVAASEPKCPASCVSVTAMHEQIHVAGRYLKLSRELPQTPWVLNGQRMMESSVQEIIFVPIAKVYDITAEEAEHRLKFMSAGREDVDVMCLGNGRPFAIEISDPRREPTESELESICEEINKDKRVRVDKLVVINREQLTELKKGEENKCKTYEAVCIKLTHNKDEPPTENGSTEVKVTQSDIDKINSYTNVREGKVGKIHIRQKTPIRVLHRRPLLNRKRKILELEAELIPDHPKLFKIKVKTDAGAYIKEWVHGELGRTKPSLGSIIQSDVDIIALNVTHVHLDWPSGV